MNKKNNFVIIYNFVIKASLVLVFSIDKLANITLMGKIPKNIIKVKINKIHFELVLNAL